MKVLGVKDPRGLIYNSLSSFSDIKVLENVQGLHLSVIDIMRRTYMYTVREAVAHFSLR